MIGYRKAKEKLEEDTKMLEEKIEKRVRERIASRKTKENSVTMSLSKALFWGKVSRSISVYGSVMLKEDSKGNIRIVDMFHRTVE